MSKNEFLKKLSDLLHMLKEDEVNDIISEYEQHIDMKVAEGLSEEDAIAAFGTVEELATEILDAYHVKPNFKEKKKIEVMEKVQSESRKAIKNAGDAGKGIWSRLTSTVKKAASACKRLCLAPFLFLKRIFTKKKDNSELNVDKSVKVKKEWQIGKGIKALFRGLVRLIRKIWYGCILLLFGTAGVAFILTLGILIVLLVLGYPVIGVTIAFLGLVMAVNAVAYYAGSKWRRV